MPEAENSFDVTDDHHLLVHRGRESETGRQHSENGNPKTGGARDQQELATGQHAFSDVDSFLIFFLV